MLDCRVSLKGYQGAIEIVKKEYANENSCEWTIEAPKGSKINITFTLYKIPRSFVFLNDDDDDNEFNLYSQNPQTHPTQSN